LPLPPGLSAAEFDNVCRELRFVVGDEWVVTADDKVASYHYPYFPGVGGQHAPSGAVLPSTVEEIRAVLRIANRAHLPLWSVSLGRNYVYGGGAPRLLGSMVLDLKRMQAIEVNEQLAYAIVEPGVTFFQLYKFIQDRKYRLWISCPAPGWGSVLGNTLERGVGYTPHGDHAGQQCGMEIVLANGDVVRTGMGAMTDNPAWPLYKYGFGPSLDGLFMQSNFGVVTKIGVWLMPEPELYSPVDVGVPREEDIVALVDTLRPLRLDGTVPTATIANWMRIVATQTTRAQWYDGKDAMPPSAIEKLKQTMRIPHWGLRFGLYGPARVVDEKFKIVQKAFSGIRNGGIVRARYPRGARIAKHHHASAGIPDVELMPLNWMGGTGAHIECPPVVPMVGAQVYELYRKRTALFASYGFDHYCGLTTTTPRAFLNTGSIIFDRSDPEMTRRARELSAALIREAAKSRLGGYRGHIAEMDLIAAQFDFNSHAALRTCELIKDALDPEGILSPGKLGVGPTALRSARREEERK
jgi:4-cresol dehydrogenase (hydroxylating)